MIARALVVVLSLASSLLVAGCFEDRALTWRYELPAGVDPGVIVIARIRENGCNDGDPVIYEARPRDASRPTIVPPALDPDDTYCFDVVAEDPSMGCAMVARSTIAVVLGTADASREVVNVLETTHPRLLGCAAPALCTTEVGCLRCDDTENACDGPPRCCPGIFECSEAITLEEGTCASR